MWTLPFLICTALVATGAWHLRKAFLSLRRTPAPDALPPQELSLFDVAYLHGGTAHAAVTAFLAMRLEGRLILSRSGTVTVTDPAPRNDVEGAIISAAGPTRQKALRELAPGVRTSAAVRALGVRLTREGAILQPITVDGFRYLAKHRAFHGWMLVAALVVGVVTVPVATATGNGGLPSLLAFLLLLALGSVPVFRYRIPDPLRSGKENRRQFASLQGDAAWQPADVGLATETTAALKPFALGSTTHVPGMADDEVQTLLNEFRAVASAGGRRSAATAATATAAAGAAATGYSSGSTTPGQGGCGGSDGSAGGHSSCGGHSCGGGCGGGCGGCGG
ncbi:TIGR04222 domain-containing membrane protein [Streptomyces sp. VNUA116]|uniref:TIGR04222 domain-containing membrane protein n=1 Tax=Streptomyces sp. VNUA116 TaxID=3062449 RepID=UPI002676AA58|nr:TIGR04222 domain-containing membrane protein [Streptomyces sp. VNUA116]WKU43075.1 TIGR04222 domain-containing membrane protein [Streptomyces sp. VNUA116]